MIAVDLDGTCVRYEPCFEVDPVFLDCIRPWLSEGGKWMMNSDRGLDDMFGLAQKLSPADRPCAVLSRQKDIYLRQNGDYVSHDEWNSKTGDVFDRLFGKIMPEFPAWERMIESKFSVSARFVGPDAFAFMVPKEEILELHRFMRELVNELPEAGVSGNDAWCFILPRDFSKGRLLREAARVFDIDVAGIIAVGDGVNDISMLDGSVTPLVGCPANAMDDVMSAVRKAGGIAAPQHCARGTAHVVESYIGGGV